jgi:segregation and condensation protein A
MPANPPHDAHRPRRRLGLGAGTPGPAVAEPQAGVVEEPEPRAGVVEPEPSAAEQPERALGEPAAPSARPEPAPSSVRPEPGGPEPSAAEPGPGSAASRGGRTPPEEGGDGPQGASAEPEEDAEGPREDAEGGGNNRFTVRLVNFEGPFDLLLQLISKHKLDVTEVALSKVTNEFMAHINAMGPDWDLDQTTEFLVVAATLLDLKAARLLPAAEVEDEADLALLEARDLLFARLLQYRAYKRIAAIFAERLEQEALSRPRTVGLEPQHAELLPEVVLSVGPERFARLAVKAMQPKPRPQVYVDHIHAPLVSVREQAQHVVAVLRELGAASFRDLTADAADTLTVVARFLALLELYREKAVALDQEEALGELQVRWTGGAEDTGTPLVTDEFDQEAKPASRRVAGGAAGNEPPRAAQEAAQGRKGEPS